jgi:hypothetical protein
VLKVDENPIQGFAISIISINNGEPTILIRRTKTFEMIGVEHKVPYDRQLREEEYLLEIDKLDKLPDGYVSAGIFDPRKSVGGRKFWYPKT